MISDAQEIIDYIDIEATEVETLQIENNEPERKELVELVQSLSIEKVIKLKQLVHHKT